MLILFAIPRMKIISLRLRKFFQMNLIKLKAHGKCSKKRCFFVLSFYIFCIVAFILYIKNKLKMNKYENCTIQNVSILEIEKNLSRNVDNYITMFVKDIVIENIPVTQKWTQIASNVYVYSVFLEFCPFELLLNSKFCIKFIGTVFSNYSSVSPFLSTLNCIVKNDSVSSKEEHATIELLPESHFTFFTAAFLFCPVINVNSTHASLCDDKCLNLKWLPIENNIFPAISNPYRSSHDTHGVDFIQAVSLCVRPMYKKFSVTHFSEFLAYYSVMGIDHFIFYYLKSLRPLDMFLKFLKYTNISHEVHLWNIPVTNDLIHEYGQIVFTQDCIARTKYKFSHTIIVDLDEYIVPQVHENIKSLVSYLDNMNTNAGSYVIPMVLFCDEYSVENFDISPFHILNHNKRQKTHWYHQYRSKYILRPERIRYSGIHFTWKFENDYKEVFVSPSVALLNHYRLCCGMAQTYFSHLLEFYVLSDKVVVDNKLLRHGDELMNNDLLKFIFNIIFDKL